MKIALQITLALLFLQATPTFAHDFWLKPDNGGAVLIYGHGDESTPYVESVVKKLTAWAGDGSSAQVSKSFANGLLKLKATNATTWGAEVDNGYWTKTIQGWKNVSKRQQTKYIKSTWDRHFAKLVPAKSPNRVMGQPIEIVLKSATKNLIEGKVLLRGKPASGMEIERDHKKVATTDAQGNFSLKPGKAGLVVLRATQQEKLDNNPDADFLNLTTTLTVEI